MFGDCRDVQEIPILIRVVTEDDERGTKAVVLVTKEFSDDGRKTVS